MYGSAIFGIGAGIFAGAGNASAFSAHSRAFEFCPAFCFLGAIPSHAVSCSADRNAIGIDGEIIFVNRRSSAFAIQVDKGSDIFTFAVFVLRHCVMSGIKQKL